MNHIFAPLASIFLHYHSLTPLTEDYLAERDEVLLLEVGHGGADVAADAAAAGGRGGVEGDDVEDAAAVEEEARLVHHQDLGRVEGAAGQRVGVDVPAKKEG